MDVTSLKAIIKGLKFHDFTGWKTRERRDNWDPISFDMGIGDGLFIRAEPPADAAVPGTPVDILYKGKKMEMSLHFQNPPRIDDSRISFGYTSRCISITYDDFDVNGFTLGYERPDTDMMVIRCSDEHNTDVLKRTDILFDAGSAYAGSNDFTELYPFDDGDTDYIMSFFDDRKDHIVLRSKRYILEMARTGEDCIGSFSFITPNGTEIVMNGKAIKEGGKLYIESFSSWIEISL